MLFVFRTDASIQIGTGHVMRCLTLADALRERGANCRFVCRSHEGNLLEHIRQQGFEAIVLPAETQSEEQTEPKEKVLDHAEWLGAPWQVDAQQTLEALNDECIDWLIVDHYALDERWESALWPQCKHILVIDDLADRDHNCDVLLDQNLIADYQNRYDHRVSSCCARLLGPEYALLQPSYAELRPRTPPRVDPIQRILVYFGGSDTHDLTGQTLSAFLALERADIILDVVINPAAANADSVRARTQGLANITVHDALPSLAPLMVKADLAIGAGGATSWERCCLGLPSLIITIAENQRPIAAELDRQGLARYVGHFDTVTGTILLSTLREALDLKELEIWSRRCAASVDGGGTACVASIVTLDHQAELIAREATVSDEKLLLEWANDPVVRQNAFHTEQIRPDEHRAWFYKRLRNPELCRIFILKTENGFPVGQVRFEVEGDAWEIDFSLHAAARGKGLGGKILQTALREFRRLTPGAFVLGRVKPSNLTSEKVFEALDFKRDQEGGGLAISICSDLGSWMNDHIPPLILDFLAQGHKCTWAHNSEELSGGDCCFYLSYGRIVDRTTLNKYRNNLVVHASDLPKGRGWSPTSWMILQGENRIPVTLIEALEKVDSGPIYSQDWVNLDDTDLIEDWQKKLARSIVQTVRLFVAGYPQTINEPRLQEGCATYFSKRAPKDSELKPEGRLADQFELLRIVDNERYPAYFIWKGKRFNLKIEHG